MATSGVLPWSVTSSSMICLLLTLNIGLPVTAAAGPPPPPSRQQDPARGPVFISEPPPRLSFPNTRGAVIPCSAYGLPAPVLDWQLADGTPLDDIPGLRRVLANNSLYFHPFGDEDARPDVHAARYRCVAANTAGTVVSRYVKVNAVVVNKFRTYNVNLNDVYVTAGNTAVLKCSINPYFMREHVRVVSWTNGGKPVTAGGRYSVLTSGELHVRNAASRDSYVMYKCITRNVITSEVKASDPATIYVIDPVNSAPALEVAMTRVTVRQGAPAELPCVASGFPLPTYVWSRHGDVIDLRHDRVLRAGGNLVLRETLVSDSGAYTCEASNDMGRATATVTLTVTSPLSAHVEPEDQTVDVGQPAIFNCTVHGSPTSHLQWLKDGAAVVPDETVTFPTKTSLEIATVRHEDRGMYQCMVSNSEENAQGAGQLSLGVAKPLLVERFKDLYVRPGSMTSLKCSVSGNPAPVIRWTLDDAPLPTDDRFRIVDVTLPEGDVTSFVNITHARVEDGGVYRCAASNEVGEVSHVGKLNVYGLPYIRPMDNVTVVASHVLVMRCHVSGYPIMEVNWSKGGSQLPANHRQHVTKDGTLTVDDVTRGLDDGPYTCTARNYENNVASREVFVHILEPPKIDHFRFPARKKGDRVSISCVVSSGDLPILITWRKDNRPVSRELGVITQSTGAYSSMLSIGDASPRHNGNYTCIARNRAATASYSAAFHVDVPPRWVVEPQDSFVVLGGSVRLECQTDGTPKPTVVWKRSTAEEPGTYRELVSDSVNGTDSDGTSRTVQLRNGSLIISDAMATDHGHYLCHAGNGVGAALSKIITLTVHIPAHFIESTRNYTVRRGEALVMECVANGDRPLSVAWSFDGRNMDALGDRVEITYYNTENGRGSKLQLQSTIRNDSGVYVCNAKNKFGSDVILFDLLVQETPDAPSGVELRQVGSRSVEMTWKAAYNGNSPVTGYIVQCKNFSDPWASSFTLNFTATARQLSAPVTDLRPAFDYHFRVIAKNRLGLGRPSRQVAVTMGEEAPSGPPTDVRTLAIGSQSLKVTWRPPLIELRNGDIAGYYVGYKEYNSSAPYMYVTKAVPPETPSPLEETLENLEKFTKYTVHVQAYNTQGAGPRSDDVTVLTLEDVPSQPPQAVQATALSSRSIMMVWSPPPHYTLHGVLQGYKVLYKPVRHDEDEVDAEVLTTSRLSAAIYGLLRYTNYSLQVLAYTRRGEGVRSEPIYVRTQQDLPDRPADIKAVAAGPETILVTWRKPLHPNGVLTKYTVLMQDVDTHLTAMEKTIEIPPDQLSYRATGLTRNHKYSFRVGASTVVGDGDTTYSVTVATVDRISAQIASFSRVIHASWRTDVELPCVAVGEPAPSVSWYKNRQPLVEDKRTKISANGTLYINHVTTEDAGNYTCRAGNAHGADEITTYLSVQAPPRAPTLTVAVTTPGSVQVNWRSGSNGGSPIKGFKVSFRRDHGDWTTLPVGPNNRSHTAATLRCGTRYRFRVLAFNAVGDGVPSNEVEARTNGSAPIMPPQSILIKQLNSTFVDLDLTTWLVNGCPLTSFDIRYRYWGHDQWETVDNFIDPNTKVYRVELHPATWYVMRVTAYSDAGSTDATLKFATPTYHGSTIQPIRLVHTNRLAVHERPFVMIPLIGCLVVSVVLIVALVLFFKRRRDKLSYKAENASNLRRDLTAETSLMSDLDKRLNLEQLSRDRIDPTDSGSSSNKSMTGGKDGKDRNSGSSLNNGSDEDKDGVINPYATFQRRPPVEGDTAVKEIILAHLPGDPILQTSPSSLSTVHRERPRSMPRYQNIPHGLVSQHSQGLILCPQQYARLESLNSIFTANMKTSNISPTQATDETPPNLGSSGPGSTTVPSNHEELARTFGTDKSPTVTSGTPSYDVTDVGGCYSNQSQPAQLGRLPRAMNNRASHNATLPSRHQDCRHHGNGPPAAGVQLAEVKTLPAVLPSRRAMTSRRSPSKTRGTPRAAVPGSPDECLPLFSPDLPSIAPASTDQLERDRLLDRYYATLQTEEDDALPGSADEVVVLKARRGGREFSDV